jgi:hypothetical protein
MKKATFISSIILFAFIFNSCNRCVDGSGKIMNSSTELKKFNEIEIDVPANVQIRQGTKYSVDIQADENILKRIEANVSGNTLKIKSNKCIKNFKVLDINITTPEIKEIELNGSGNISSSGIIKTDKLYIEINGSGKNDFSVDTKKLKITINGSGDFVLKGITKQLNLETNGSGNFDAFTMDCLKAYIEINGSGNCKVKPIEKLDVEISGSGNVYYKGVPEDIEVAANGSGKLIKQ